jgi:hypothetical protein
MEKKIYFQQTNASKQKKKETNTKKRQLPEFSFNFFFAYVSPFCQFLQKIKKTATTSKNKKKSNNIIILSIWIFFKLSHA